MRMVCTIRVWYKILVRYTTDSQCDAFSQVMYVVLLVMHTSNMMLCDNLPFKRVRVVVQRVRHEVFSLLQD